MKFLHTADWQIGMQAAHAGEAGDVIRQRRLDSARGVMRTARERDVDFVLVAGDTFEHNGVRRVLVQQVADILGEAQRPVYVIPGNHDPLIPGSVWGHPAWEAQRDVHVLEVPEPVLVPGGTLHPCPLTESRSLADPTASIPPDGGDGIRIGMAHGTLLALPVPSPDHPIALDACTRAGLDYLALGHWHSTSTYEDEDGALRTAYSGTHEPTSFGERDSGNVLLVQIDEPGQPPRVEKVSSALLRWMDVQRDVQVPSDLDVLLAEIEGIVDARDVLIRVVVTGHVTPRDARKLSHLDDLTASRFLHARLDTSGLRTAPGDHAWISQLPQGAIRETAIRLHDMAGAGDREAQVAMRALLMLWEMVAEVES